MNKISDMVSKIYNSEYFVPALFILIVILAVIFLILVFSGKKKKNVSETNSNNNGLEKNLETINNVNSVNEQPIQNVALQDSVVALTVEPTVASPIEQNNVMEPAKDIFADPIVEAPQSIETNISTEPVIPTAQPIEPGAPVEPAVEAPVEDFGKMNFTFEPVEDTVNEVPAVPTVAESTIEPVVPENNDLFNTSIFHNIPTELANATVDVPTAPVVEEPQIEKNSSLFEPVPNLDVTIPIDTATSTSVEETPANVKPVVEPKVSDIPVSFEQTPVETSMPVEPVVDLPKAEYQERVVQPTQFSSVYINKEEPKVEQPKVEIPNESKVPPYDPTLFERKFDPVPEIKPVMPEVETTPTVSEVETKIETPETPSIDNFIASLSTAEPEAKETSVEIPTIDTSLNNEDSKVDIPGIASLPALDPMENIDVNPLKEEEPVKVNPKNTFDFELPSLAKETPNNDNSNVNLNNSFPNVSGETYDIK